MFHVLKVLWDGAVKTLEANDETLGNKYKFLWIMTHCT